MGLLMVFLVVFLVVFVTIDLLHTLVVTHGFTQWSLVTMVVLIVCELTMYNCYDDVRIKLTMMQIDLQ